MSLGEPTVSSMISVLPREIWRVLAFIRRIPWYPVGYRGIQQIRMH